MRTTFNDEHTVEYTDERIKGIEGLKDEQAGPKNRQTTKITFDRLKFV